MTIHRIPNPDDFPGTLYDLLDDVIEDDWTKKNTVTKVISYIHTPHPTKLYRYKHLRCKINIFSPQITNIHILINYVLGRTNTTIVLTSSCLVLDRNVVNAWLIIYASLILCFDILQYSRGLFPKLFPRKTYEKLHVSSSSEVKIPLWSQDQHRKYQHEDIKTIQNALLDLFYLYFAPPQTLMGSFGPLICRNFPIFSVSNVGTRV